MKQKTKLVVLDLLGSHIKINVKEGHENIRISFSIFVLGKKNTRETVLYKRICTDW